MSEKLVLIDGHSILNRAFYGLPDLTNSEGLHTNAVYGFLNIMFKILEEESADYLIVAFDLNAPTFRHKMFTEYKGTRKPMPEELREQVPLIRDTLKAMGVTTVQMEGYEADDLLGTISKQMESKGLEVSVVSGDRDLLQLATDKIKIRIPKTKRTGTEIEDYNTQDVIERYQVTPIEFIDVKALMGDASDNIPGIPGVGEKTATKIIVEFGSIENAYEHLDEIKPNKARESLQNNYDKARLSKELATIHIDSPIEYDIKDAKLTNLYTPEAYEVFRRLEFKNFLNRFDMEPAGNKIEEQFQFITMLDEAESIFSQAMRNKTVGFSFVTENNQIMGLALAYSITDIYFIQAQGFISAEYLTSRVERMMEVVEQLSSLNWKQELNFIQIKEEYKCHAYDIGLAAYLINPLKDHYDYDDIAKEHLDLMVSSRVELLGKTGNRKALAENSEKFLQYAGYIAYISYASVAVLTRKLQEMKMYTLLIDIEIPLMFSLFDMEQEGILVEAEALKIYGAKLKVRILELEKEIYQLAGEEFNINSPKQLGVILFEHLKLPNAKKTKTGYSTAADVLERLAPDYPIVSLILEYRQFTKLKSTYADGLANYIMEDKRIHSTFNQTITATGRISSTEPNLQNIPIRMELGRLIRKVFIPREGCVFIDADYSQIELRVLAHMSQDETLIQAYKEAQDIHRITASQVFHTPFEEVTDLQRRNAKAVNFGIVYGISSFGLSQDLSITKKEAGEYIDKYFETYPKVKQFLDEAVAEAKRTGYVTTMFGRRRPIPELGSSNFMQRSFGERIAMNSPIQGTAADIIKIAMIRVSDSLKNQNLRSRLILQVHDELLIEAYTDEIEQVKAILSKEMCGAAQLAVPLEIDMHTGDNWYEAK